MLMVSDSSQKDFLLLTDLCNEMIVNSRTMAKDHANTQTILKETIANLSHDIRTPLTSMDGYFQLLAQSDSIAEREHYTQIIRSRITDLETILEELFTYAKLEDPSYQFPITTIDFSKSVHDVLFSYYEEFETQHITIEADFADGPIWIEGNADALSRILQNILKNARDHGSHLVSLRLYPQDSFICFSCSNHVSNPKDLSIEKIFSRFYTADPARTRSTTGLGLSIAKALTQKLGGEINATLSDNIFTIEIRFKCQTP
jgi:signal transduction histidine kinase